MDESIGASTRTIPSPSTFRKHAVRPRPRAHVHRTLTQRTRCRAHLMGLPTWLCADFPTMQMGSVDNGNPNIVNSTHAPAAQGAPAYTAATGEPVSSFFMWLATTNTSMWTVPYSVVLTVAPSTVGTVTPVVQAIGPMIAAEIDDRSSTSQFTITWNCPLIEAAPGGVVSYSAAMRIGTHAHNHIDRTTSAAAPPLSVPIHCSAPPHTPPRFVRLVSCAVQITVGLTCRFS
jgi:hypothetical protein